MALDSCPCFICGVGVQTTTPKTISLSSSSASSSQMNLLDDTSIKSDNLSFLSNNLDVIFILRKLLEVPSTYLEDQLRECGSDPGNWIRLCDQCSQLTRNARELDRKIKKIEKELRCVQKQFLDQLSSSKGPDSTIFRAKISSFVKSHDYLDPLNEDDPGGFLEGDKLAKYLASKHNSKILLIQEKSSKEEIKIEVESPPSSPLGIEETPSSTSEHSSDSDDNYSIKTTTKRKSKPRFIRRGSHDCPHCKIQLKTQKSLANHVNQVHLNKFKITCLICGKGFPLKRLRDIHMLTIHEDDPVTLKLKEERGISYKTCSMVGCDTIFLSNEAEDKHMKKVHGGDKDKVDLWEKWKLEGAGGQGKLAEDGQVLCGECGNWYRNWGQWCRHFRKGHQGKDLKCPWEDCEMMFKFDGDIKNKFKDHFETSHEKKKIICNICGQEMVNQEMLKTHKLTTHYEEGPWICEICGVEKSSYGNLYYHRKSVHKVNMKGKPLKDEVKKKENELCNLCGKEFRSKSSLDNHVMGVHRKEYKLSCHVCGVGKADQRESNIHLFRMHEDDPVTRQLEEGEGLRLRRCEVSGCSGVYLRKEEMDKHVERMHEGGEVVNKFECKYCGKGFWRKRNLGNHERGHERGMNNGKPVKCEICGKGFDSRNYLRGHQRKFHKLKLI